jgi:hypothetical protein
MNITQARANVVAVLAGVCLPWAVLAAESTDHSQHQSHSGHQMTAEQIATLKAKIPLYAQYTDEQINQSMVMMPGDNEAYLSAPAVRDKVGILALGHGYSGGGNEQFKAGYSKIAMVHPTAVGLGMAMMDSAHIQKAVDNLVAAGAETIVVLPTEVGQETSLVRQWDYIFGRRNTSAYLDVPRVKTPAKIVMAQTPTRSPVIGQILADNIRGISRNPAKEAVMLIMHGPEEAADNEKELANLKKHAEAVQRATNIAAVNYASLQDDAPPAIRQANVNRMREWISQQLAAGKTVLVAPVLMTSGGGVSRRIERDLGGLNYTVVDKGITEHPLFDRWVRETVAAELGKTPG